jgi:hypothetical protein
MLVSALGISLALLLHIRVSMAMASVIVLSSVADEIIEFVSGAVPSNS